MSDAERRYWDQLSGIYQAGIRISCSDFHYGPLVPGDRALRLLPRRLAGLRTLELGCGAAQNSIVLSRRQAQCTALDLSLGQLRIGKLLARRHDATIRFVQGDLDALPFGTQPRFDLVHSVYALPFARRPERVLTHAARLLRPGGILLLSTAHPLFAGEWLEVDDGEFGVFLPDYFSPPQDRREEKEGAGSRCRSVPVSTVFGWLRNAGLTVDTFLEPRPLPLAPARGHSRPPYDSPGWRDLYPKLARAPVVAVFRAVKPAD